MFAVNLGETPEQEPQHPERYRESRSPNIEIKKRREKEGFYIEQVPVLLIKRKEA